MERIVDRRSFKPARLPLTIFYKGGLCLRSLNTELSVAIQGLARAHGMGFASIETTDENGLGPDEVMENLQFRDLMESCKAEILSLANNGHKKFLLSGHSLYGWAFAALALDPELKELIVGVLLLAPAMDSLTKFYKMMEEGLELSEDDNAATLLEKMKAGGLIRMEGIPYKKGFMESSWPFELAKLKLYNLRCHSTIVIGEEDERVSVAEALRLHQLLPKNGAQRRLVIEASLTHAFSDRLAFQIVMDELKRLAIIALEAEVKEVGDWGQLNKKEWIVIEKIQDKYGKYAYYNIATGKIVDRIDRAEDHQAKHKEGAPQAEMDED